MIRNRFRRLADRPIEGLPPGWDRIGSGRLARRLLDSQVPAGEVDAVWAELIGQARTREETAVLVCAGIALPMLGSITAKLCGLWFNRADTESMVVTAFLDALAEVDPTRPNVAGRLRWATFNRACPGVRERRRAPIPVPWFCDSGPVPGKDDVVSRPPHGHPELLLARAVDEGVISAADAGLITDTRLDHRRLDDVAVETGIGYAALAKRRRRAEQRLVPWLRRRITDAQTCSEVEIAALDGLVHHRRRPTRHRSAAAMSKNRPAFGVLPPPESATSADHTPHEEDPRCA